MNGYRVPVLPRSNKIRTYVGDCMYLLPAISNPDFAQEIRVEVLGYFGAKLVGRVLTSSITDVPVNSLVELVGYTFH